MSRPPLHMLKSRSGANGRRMVLVLMAVAAGVLLAVPAAASADVNKAHAKQYKQTLE